MVSFEDIQAAYYMVAASGVLVAAVFYILNLRISRRNQKLTLKAQQQTLETRQAQFFMQIYEQVNSEESQRRFIDVMNMEWSDYDDFERKYGSDEHPDLYAKRSAKLYQWEGVGYLLKSGVIDRKTAYSLVNRIGALWLWRKFEPIIREQRVRYNNPESYSDLEYLAMETAKELEERGFSSKSPEGFAHYTSKSSQ